MQKDTRNFYLVIIRLVWLAAVVLFISGTTLRAHAAHDETVGLGEDQANEKQELENMKQELSDIKNSINEGLQSLNKVDTHALKNLQEFHLFCKSAICEIAPGKKIECLSYNGILPGPTLRVKEGQLVRLIVHNQLDINTSMDFHGIILPFSVDGLPNSQSGLVKPGETYVYQFIAKPAGTYWYHPQIIHADQKIKGMYGAFIVDPAETTIKSVDQDIVLVLSDMTVTKIENESYNKPIPKKSIASGPVHQANLFSRTNNHSQHNMTEQNATVDVLTSAATYTAVLPTDRQLHSVFYLVNGKTAPEIPAIEVSANSRVRLRIINSGQHAIPLHITGHKFALVALNGSPEQNSIDTLTINPSDRTDLEFTADNPGIWTLGSERIEQSSNNGKFPGGIALLIKYTSQ